ncbi:unnamed protein product [Adineta ricciae]|uniref:Uncharacterized protein n=1 Tax=Adineta ricciae TaxID=249248 RepID=A0A815MCF6_ADIRI|nr:unnamed protein product [Adineta ricciae]
MELFQERTRKELPASSSLTYVQENEIADLLFNVFESIWTSTSYNEENEITLDHNTMDNEIEECEGDMDYEAKDEENPVVTKREIVNEAEIKKSADQFVSEAKPLLPYYNEDFVLNTDQAGLEGEFPSTRTLSYQREKTTLVTVRSVNATTHSYTVHPTITMSGKIFGPVYICLKEVNDQMSDNIKANLPQLKNVVVTCSASGKLTISL